MPEQVKGPVVEGKLSGTVDKSYIPFSDTAGAPVLATEQYVDGKVSAGWTVYKTYAGEMYDDKRLPDVILVDGSMDNDITASLALTSDEIRRFYFVNLSEKHEIHIFQGAFPAYVVGGPMSTSLIVANKDHFHVLYNVPAYSPQPVPQP